MRTNSHSMDSFVVCHLLFVKALSSFSYSIATSLRKSSHLPVRLFKTNSRLLAFCCNRVGNTKNLSANSFQEHLSLVVKSSRPAELICRRPSDAPCGIGSVCHRTRFCASLLIMACDVSGSEERHPEDGTWQGTFVACISATTIPGSPLLADHWAFFINPKLVSNWGTQPPVATPCCDCRQSNLIVMSVQIWTSY